ncbi:MAG TPA: RIO1 family regulatory kinase/ATPase [Actinomycetota bacterium]|nr:RIO1 family regulatory kinase/ATPase [Actinomycetota bacterium]
MVRASIKKKLLDQVERNDPELQHLVARDRPSLVDVAARRGLLASEAEEPEIRSTERTFAVDGVVHSVPQGLITEFFQDEVIGPIKGGKEGEVTLLRRSNEHRAHLLAEKTYRAPSQRSFRRDQIYREGRKIARGRARKAVEQGTAYGRSVMATQWAGVEFLYLRKLWAAGVRVPVPVNGPGPLLMEFLGDEDRAAPRLVDARLSKEAATSICDQLLTQLRLLTSEGVVHGDLSAYNVLVWEDEAWLIDFPQAVDLAVNPHALDLLHRDVHNVCRHFSKYGLHPDPEEEFADLVALAFE